MWHILTVGLPPGFAPTGPEEDAPALARRCAAAGAFVAIAHPDWYQIDAGDGLRIDAAHAVEVYNHTAEVNAARGGGAGLLDALLARGRRPGAIAVDDSHWKSPDAFGGWVMVKAERNEPGALVAALKAGHHYASQGPELHDIALDGDAVAIACSGVSSAMLLGPGSRAEVVHGEAMRTARLPLARFAGSWCRAVVTDAAGRRAWSNPYWPPA